MRTVIGAEGIFGSSLAACILVEGDESLLHHQLGCAGCCFLYASNLLEDWQLLAELSALLLQVGQELGLVSLPALLLLVLNRIVYTVVGLFVSTLSGLGTSS